MITGLLTLLVVVLVLCLVYWAIHKLAATFGLSPQIVVVIDVLLVVVAVIFLVVEFLPLIRARLP